MIAFLFTYTPLVSSDTFTGVQADVNLTAIAILGLMLTVAAVGILYRIFFGR